MRYTGTVVQLARVLLIGLLLASMLLDGVLLPLPVQARDRCFAQTGYCVRGAILEYWEEHGGVEVFGYPITPLRTETIEGEWTGPVQWFERDRLEDHGLAGVQFGRLGASLLEQQGYDWEDATHQVDPAPGCLYNEITRHNVCEPFLSYWQEHGAVERIGYPLTEAFTGAIGSWRGTIQYFERRQLEYHADPAGGAGRVLSGLLGREVERHSGATHVCDRPIADELRDSLDRVPFRSTLGCQGEVYQHVSASVQSFERGRMIRVDLGKNGKKIYVLSNMPALFQASYDDSWKPRQSTGPDQNAPQGLFKPQKGFGKVWQEQAKVAQLLGWATGPEQRERAIVQRFDAGWLLWLQQSNKVYAFGPEPSALVFFSRPELTRVGQSEEALLAGEPAPIIDGELVVQTQSVDFYRLPGGLTPGEILALSTAVEQSIARGSSMLGSHLIGRVALRFEPEQEGPCAIRGLTLSNERTIRMFYAPGSNLWNIEAILAHEFIHQLQHDYYGARDHLRSDVILLEGMAMWGSSPYYLDMNGQPWYHTFAKQALLEGNLLPLTVDLEADCRTTTRTFIYDQWASFVEYLIITYGREKFDVLYAASTGRPAGSANYQGVYGKTLDELEADWVTWLTARS